MPAEDFVVVPPRRAYFDEINAYRTRLHELVHATGHASRLGRDLTNPFGSAGYAREELIAEMGSAFLCASLGIVPTVRHADYIGAWLDVLREDSRAIFRAASAASKAADWLLERHAERLSRVCAGGSGMTAPGTRGRTSLSAWRPRSTRCRWPSARSICWARWMVSIIHASASGLVCSVEDVERLTASAVLTSVAPSTGR